MKILIVEDEMIISDDIESMLLDSGYEVVGQAGSFEDAISIFSAKHPDLVLLDIQLSSQKDGIQVAEKINELGKTPFIYTSSLGDSVTIERAKQTKPAAYLMKPFREEQLMTAIEIALHNFSDKKEGIELADKIPMIDNAIFIKSQYKFSKVPIDSIQYISKSDNYLDIHTDQKKHLLRGSIGSFLEQINRPNFIRTHRSFAVNINAVTDIAPTALYINKTEIPLAKSYAERVMRHFKIL